MIGQDTIKLIVLMQCETTQDLRLVRGELPWSLAGISGRYRPRALERREMLVDRIESSLLTWGIEVKLVKRFVSQKLQLAMRLSYRDPIWRAFDLFEDAKDWEAITGEVV